MLQTEHVLRKIHSLHISTEIFFFLFLYFFVIHHCKTAFHHCTFCASLHVKTSPGMFPLVGQGHGAVGTAVCSPSVYLSQTRFTVHHPSLSANLFSISDHSSIVVFG